MKKVIIILITLIALGGCKKNTNELIMVTEAGFAGTALELFYGVVKKLSPLGFLYTY